VWLEGYGAYAITEDPYFSTTRLPWLDRGGVFAYVHARGGGEYGESWHLAGMKAQKQHTIDDFIAAARYLIAHRWTSSAHVAINGGSAGGIPVSGVVTQQPGLIAAAIDDVGVNDAVRFEVEPNGPINIAEFGTVQTPAGFRSLYAVDGYLHVRDGTPYPAVMVTTGINDPRVEPWESAKFAARLQAATAGRKPVLLRVDFDAGHGYGSTLAQALALIADEQVFALWQLGDPAFAAVPTKVGPYPKPSPAGG
jgi:prolyl oligopeptidase